MSSNFSRNSVPRATIHKQILDQAESNPSMSIDDLAAEVAGASPELVESVLNEYGDPGSDTSASDESKSSEPAEAYTVASTELSTPTAESPAEKGPESTGDDPELAGNRSAATKDEQSDSDAAADPIDGGSSSGNNNDESGSGNDTHVGDPKATDAGTGVKSEDVDHDHSERSTDDSGDSGDESSEESASDPGSMTDDPASNSGDAPAHQSDAAVDLTDPEADSEAAVPISTSELTQEQYETLEAIYHNPSATQAELADLLDVSRATISVRANAVPGFEWADRETFTAELFDETTGTSSEDSGHIDGRECSDTTATSEQCELSEKQFTALSDRIDDLSEQVSDLSETVSELEEDLGNNGGATDSHVHRFDDAELLHKALNAWMESEHISDEEEVELIDRVLF
ncbi:MarR family transcriptional regulator [Halobaculum sp. EA56]|uniref:MarR family transcriptional regulator n=1 Tax=Halobaculum sp. EA56 TaxID=3421648 RepID=UPI003EB910E6